MGLFYFFCQIFFFSHHAACRILVPQPVIEPRSLAVEARSPNHWATREFPNLKKNSQIFNHNFFGCVSSPASFLLSCGTQNTWILDLLLSSPHVPEALFICFSVCFLFVVQVGLFLLLSSSSVTLSPVIFCCWAHPLTFLFQVLCFLVLKFLWVSSLYLLSLLWLCVPLLTSFYFSFVSGAFVVAHWSILWWLLKSCLVILCVISVLVSIDHLFSFHLRCSWFLLWWEFFFLLKPGHFGYYEIPDLT